MTCAPLWATLHRPSAFSTWHTHAQMPHPHAHFTPTPHPTPHPAGKGLYADAGLRDHLRASDNGALYADPGEQRPKVGGGEGAGLSSWRVGARAWQGATGDQGPRQAPMLGDPVRTLPCPGLVALLRPRGHQGAQDALLRPCKAVGGLDPCVRSVSGANSAGAIPHHPPQRAQGLAPGPAWAGAGADSLDVFAGGLGGGRNKKDGMVRGGCQGMQKGWHGEGG